VTFSLLASLVVALTLLPMLASRTFKFEAPERHAGEAGRDGAKAAAGRKPRLGFLLLPYRGLMWLIGMILKGLGLGLRFLWSFLSQLLAFIFRLVSLPFRPLLGAVFRGFNRGYGRFVAAYERLLRWSLDHKAKVMVATTVFFVVTFALGTQVRRELMPRMKTNSFELQLKTPVDYSLEQTSEIAGSLERFLASRPAVRKTLSQVGIVSGLEALNPDVSLNSARIFVAVEKPAQVEGTLDSLRAELRNFPDVGYTLTREQSAMADLLGLSTAEISLRIKGEDLERLKEISDELVGAQRRRRDRRPQHQYRRRQAGIRVRVRREASPEIRQPLAGGLGIFW
jgi:HAE1 family hydrophobic/amphiphilic exporter-1